LEIVAFHIDPLLTAEELGELVQTTLTEESGRDLIWCADPSASAVFALAKGGFGELILIDREGRVAYKGDFPRDGAILQGQLASLL
jgi:hypothetical protein